MVVDQTDGHTPIITRVFFILLARKHLYITVLLPIHLSVTLWQWQDNLQFGLRRVSGTCDCRSGDDTGRHGHSPDWSWPLGSVASWFSHLLDNTTSIFHYWQQLQVLQEGCRWCHTIPSISSKGHDPPYWCLFSSCVLSVLFSCTCCTHCYSTHNKG